MKILVICDFLFPQTVGGAGRVAGEVATALEKMGNTVHFLTRPAPLPNDDGRITFFPPLGTLPSRFRRVFSNTVQDFKPDVVHVHQPLPAFLSIPASFSRPLVYTFHSSWPEEFKIKSSGWPRLLRKGISPLLAKVEKRVMHRATAVTVLSEFSRRMVRGFYDREAVIIPGGVDSKRFQPSPGKPENRALYLITLRNLVPRMGLAELTRSMKLLPPDTRLDIGGEGPLRRDLQELITSLGMENQVRLLGHIPDRDLPHFYSSADWFVLPTAALEGFGLVILESLSCGTPVLGTRIGAIHELLEQFDSRWVIPQPEPEAIAAAILSVSEQPPPDPWKLHNQVADEFDWLQIAERYLELYRSLL